MPGNFTISYDSSTAPAESPFHVDRHEMNTTYGADFEYTVDEPRDNPLLQQVESNPAAHVMYHIRKSSLETTREMNLQQYEESFSTPTMYDPLIEKHIDISDPFRDLLDAYDDGGIEEVEEAYATEYVVENTPDRVPKEKRALAALSVALTQDY